MREKNIKLTSIQEILVFQECAEAVQGKIIIKKENLEVNGKSLLGIMSLDVASGIKVIYPENAKDFDEFLSCLEIK